MEGSPIHLGYSRVFNWEAERLKLSHPSAGTRSCIFFQIFKLELAVVRIWKAVKGFKSLKH